jgi:hypothetical protein
VRSGQSQAEEKAKEAEQQRVEVAGKVASLAAAGEQLRREQGARQAAVLALVGAVDP